MFTSLKRHSRDEDDDEIETLRNEHKKLRSLPFRTSPSRKHSTLFSQTPRSIPNPSIIAPAESEDKVPDRFYPICSSPLIHVSSERDSLRQNEDGEEEDFIMADALPRSPLPWLTTQNLSPPEPTHLSPHAINPASGGRIPTPIYGSFFSASGSQHDTDLNMESDAEDVLSVVNSSPQQRFDMESKRRRRRLPSPISESGDDVQSPATMTGDMLASLIVGDLGVEIDAATIRDLHHAGTNEEKSWWEGSGGERHADNVRKTTFSMGFRADCEKCRSRVPGHYSHVIRT
ncbi:MAG: hypothetical protein M1827_005813 [Pycnora praestabilis]|nr:MAG: hypothetical protein M1827_005813 [Pycnora praestabilis]